MWTVHLAGKEVLQVCGWFLEAVRQEKRTRILSDQGIGVPGFESVGIDLIPSTFGKLAVVN